MSKIQDENQKYEYSYPQAWPDGSEFSVYSTKDDGRVVLRHASGSSIEFKSDGSIMVKALGDIHLNSSTNEESGTLVSADRTSVHVDTDFDLVVRGDFNVTCENFDVTSHRSIKQTTNDFIQNNNTMILKSKEQISLESSKSVYMSAKEYTENVTKRISSIGEPSAANKNLGGHNTMDVMGNTVIRNLDPKGGITIQSAGYLNLVCGGERVDLTGFVPAATAGKAFLPSTMAKATYTHLVGEGAGPIPRGVPGSVYWGVGTPTHAAPPLCGISRGWTQNISGSYCLQVTGEFASENFIVPIKTETIAGKSDKLVNLTENIKVIGIYTLNAAKIYLN